MSDQARIEDVERKISRATREAMEKYKELQVTLGQLDTTMYANWLRYSNILMQVCSEMDFNGGGDSSSEESYGDKPAVPARKKMTVPGNRQLTRDEVVAIRGYAEYHGKSFSDVSLEIVVDAGGAEK